jgi:hypothetical protein
MVSVGLRWTIERGGSFEGRLGSEAPVGGGRDTSLFPVSPGRGPVSLREMRESADEVEALTNGFFEHLSRDASFDVLQSIAVVRKEKMSLLIREAPELFLENVVSEGERSGIPDELIGYFEEPITIEEGVVRVVHADDFEGGFSRDDYFIFDQERAAQFGFYPAGASPRAFVGLKVNMRGYRLDDDVAVDVDGQGALLDPYSASLIEKVYASDDNVQVEGSAFRRVLGEQRIGVILVRDPAQHALDELPSVQEVSDAIFSGRIQRFFDEVSYSKMHLTGEVFGWFESDMSDVLRMDEFVSGALSAGVDLSPYNILMFGVPEGEGDLVVGGASLPFFVAGDIILGAGIFGVELPLGSFDSTWPGSQNVGSRLIKEETFVHELSHVLGYIIHANSWECSNGFSLMGCTHREYGNWYDIMGFRAFGSHFNAGFKHLLGWLSEDDGTLKVESHPSPSSRSVVLTLGPLEGGEGFLGARVSRFAGSPVFYLEQREPRGFDETVTISDNAGGIFINWLFESDATRLLDMHPGAALNSSGAIRDAALLEGEVFVEEESGIEIENLGQFPTGEVQVVVRFLELECGHDPEVVENVPPFDIHTLSGGSFVGGVKVRNTNTEECPPREFEVTVDTPSGWGVASVQSVPDTLDPQAEGELVRTISVPQGVSSGIYPVMFHVISGEWSTTVEREVRVGREDVRLMGASLVDGSSPMLPLPEGVFGGKLSPNGDFAVTTILYYSGPEEEREVDVRFQLSRVVWSDEVGPSGSRFEDVIEETVSVRVPADVIKVFRWNPDLDLPLSPGHYKIFVRVDPRNAIAESEEGNNFRGLDLMVRCNQASPYVDYLRPTVINVFRSDLDFGPQELRVPFLIDNLSQCYQHIYSVTRVSVGDADGQIILQPRFDRTSSIIVNPGYSADNALILEAQLKDQPSIARLLQEGRLSLEPVRVTFTVMDYREPENKRVANVDVHLVDSLEEDAHDLEPTVIRVSAEDHLALVPGQTVMFQSGVRNNSRSQGGIATPEFKTRWFVVAPGLSRVPHQEHEHPRLEAGTDTSGLSSGILSQDPARLIPEDLWAYRAARASTFRWVIPDDVKPGAYVVFYTLDPRNAISEFNENNNTVATLVRVVAPEGASGNDSDNGVGGFAPPAPLPDPSLVSPLLGDINGDNAVDIFDLAMVGRDFGLVGTGLRTDVNGDGRVDITDLVIVGRSYGERR